MIHCDLDLWIIEIVLSNARDLVWFEKLWTFLFLFVILRQIIKLQELLIVTLTWIIHSLIYLLMIYFLFELMIPLNPPVSRITSHGMVMLTCRFTRFGPFSRLRWCPWLHELLVGFNFFVLWLILEILLNWCLKNRCIFVILECWLWMV